MKKYFKSAQLCAQNLLNAGIIYLLPDVLVKVSTLIPLLFLWRLVMSQGVDVGMTSAQMTSYTFLGSVLSCFLVIKTAATGWLSEGVLFRLYGRPLSVIGQLAAETFGSFVPMLLLYSAPMLLISPLLSVNLVPATPLFFVSLILCVTLGFALDLMFACLTIKLRNVGYLIERIRAAIVAVFSGSVIPIALFPFGLADVLKYQPFASLGGAPLSVFTGIAVCAETITVQLIWNVLLWPVALLWFKKSQEGMVSYGG